MIPVKIIKKLLLAFPCFCLFFFFLLGHVSIEAVSSCIYTVSVKASSVKDALTRDVGQQTVSCTQREREREREREGERERVIPPTISLDLIPKLTFGAP